MSKGQFGYCYKDMGDALKAPQKSMFRVEENGVLYLSIGYSQTEQGVGWFDMAAIFCPFCGKKIQDEGEIKAKSAR
jgi:hypothetical protein